MVDYTTSDSGGWGAGVYIALGLIVLFVLYLIFAGGGVAPNDPAALADQVAPAATETAPVASE